MRYIVAGVTWRMSVSEPEVRSPDIQQHHRGDGKGDTEPGGERRAFLPEDHRGDRVRQDTQRGGDREDDDRRKRPQREKEEDELAEVGGAEQRSDRPFIHGGAAAVGEGGLVGAAGVAGDGGPEPGEEGGGSKEGRRVEGQLAGGTGGAELFHQRLREARAEEEQERQEAEAPRLLGALHRARGAEQRQR